MAGIATRGAARGRLRGGRVGAIAGAGWALYGLAGLSPAAKIAGALVVVVLFLALMREARRLAGATDALEPAIEAEASGRRRTLWFVAIVAGEIALLNLAVWLLSAPSLHVYWTAAIALVVGLHFAPLAILFRLPAFWGTAMAMTVLAALAAGAIRFALLPPGLASALLAFCNAAALWATVASGLADVRAATARRGAV